jgi:teichuronic acid biosynthesis glycosyltransferase TuaH
MELTLEQKNNSHSEIISPPVITGRDIVIIGLQPWYYEIGSNCKNIATHFSQHNRVLYVNLPINRKTYLSRETNPGIEKHRKIIREKGERIRKINPSMWEFYPTSLVESINWLPSTKAFKVVNYFNNRRFARDIRHALEALQFRDIILFNDNDIYNGYYLKELLKPSLYLYYCRDFLQGYDYWKKHCSVLEPELIKKADAVVANSTFYAEYCATHNPNSHYIGQGCDFTLFDHTKMPARPDEFKEISGPVIGYVGALDSARLDERILELIAMAHPEWNIVLVGPEDDFFTNSRLHSISNIFFLGRKPLSRLAEFVNAFDVCINPQLINMITRGNYPLKIDEYLAMGKPVVASRTKAMKLFEDHTYLADKPEEYVSLIEKALAEDSEKNRARRIKFAKSHTWKNSMDKLYSVISNLISKNK